MDGSLLFLHHDTRGGRMLRANLAAGKIPSLALSLVRTLSDYGGLILLELHWKVEAVLAILKETRNDTR